MFLLLSKCCRRFASTSIDLGGQMKRLNDTRQFRKAIGLFDAHSEKQPNTFAVSQALKACIRLNDFNRGIQIHHNLPSSFMNDNFIQANLIQLYSKSFSWTSSFTIRL